MNPDHLSDALSRHLTTIYDAVQGVDSDSYPELSNQLIELMGLHQATSEPTRYINHWDEQDCLVITYGDSVLQQNEKPLQTLKRFLDRYVEDSINGVHILPFYPLHLGRWLSRCSTIPVSMNPSATGVILRP